MLLAGLFSLTEAVKATILLSEKRMRFELEKKNCLIITFCIPRITSIEYKLKTKFKRLRNNQIIQNRKNRFLKGNSILLLNMNIEENFNCLKL
ncbi:hypothetical protein J2Y73_005000 [Peribacillus frigoritolerans]|uniref:hypothetical protein n=1 Tax=Peribacillus frigoritolerans TaxID=450367 RepID=UPI0011559718|nr:hypothetical protein [Peribacillus frigoritolerans]MCP1494969.1 hypothetical protein [Peribacillus frigoritolerans]